jgi:hypothetical protein
MKHFSEMHLNLTNHAKEELERVEDADFNVFNFRKFTNKEELYMLTNYLMK